MTHRELDVLIAERLLGKVSCDGYKAVWYANQGPAILRNASACQHIEGMCYPECEVMTMMGRIGGPPQYSDTSRAGLALIRELAARCDDVVMHRGPDGPWSLTIYKRGEGPDMTAIAGPCTGDSPELVIALAAAELAGVKLTAKDIVG